MRGRAGVALVLLVGLGVGLLAAPPEALAQRGGRIKVDRLGDGVEMTS